MIDYKDEQSLQPSDSFAKMQQACILVHQLSQSLQEKRALK